MKTNTANETTQQTTVVSIESQKSVTTALLLTFFFGPLGMLYSTIAGGMIMFLVSVFIGFFTLGFGLLITWPICMVWAGVAARGKKVSSRIITQTISCLIVLYQIPVMAQLNSQQISDSCTTNASNNYSLEQINEVFYGRQIFLDKNYDWSDSKTNCNIYKTMELYNESDRLMRKAKAASWYNPPIIISGGMLLMVGLMAKSVRAFLIPGIGLGLVGVKINMDTKRHVKNATKLKMDAEYNINEVQKYYKAHNPL